MVAASGPMTKPEGLQVIAFPPLGCVLRWALPDIVRLRERRAVLVSGAGLCRDFLAQPLDVATGSVSDSR